jgi:hypothetical protein
MRDTLKNKDYFDKLIAEIHKSVERKADWITTGQAQADRINDLKRAIVWDNISLIAAKYSRGDQVSELKIHLINAIEACYDSWDGFWKLKHGNPPVEYDQYILSPYDEMLWMLSLSYLLDIPQDDFGKLVVVIDRDNVKDKLYEFIISQKFPNRQPLVEESYRDYFFIPEIFSKLRQAVDEPDKIAASKLVKTFLENDWYKGHKDSGWYNSHKTKFHTYFGYWCFESAAIVKIKSLDDRTFRNHQHYPNDLV